MFENCGVRKSRSGGNHGQEQFIIRGTPYLCVYVYVCLSKAACLHLKALKPHSSFHPVHVYRRTDSWAPISSTAAQQVSARAFVMQRAARVRI
jgi:hypothetical protein